MLKPTNLGRAVAFVSKFQPLRITSSQRRRKNEGDRCIFAGCVGRDSGNTSPSAEDLKKILGSVGAEADDDKNELLLCEVKGKDITELIASGREKLASVPSGGGGAAAAAESKKEEKVEEKEESDDDMGFSLFD